MLRRTCAAEIERIVSAGEAGVFRYAVFRGSEDLAQAQHGRGDIDMLVDPSGMSAFRETVQAFGGKSGRLSRWHDNFGQPREDWFVLTENCDALIHLDVHRAISAGPRFSKRYPVLQLSDFTNLRKVPSPAGQMTAVKECDEFASTILRAAFRWPLISLSERVFLGDGGMLPARSTVQIAGQGIDVLVQGNRAYASRKQLKKLRKAVAKMPARGAAQLRHFARKSGYVLTRGSEVLGLKIWPKRTPANGGKVVALVGPDGMGKSTHVATLTKIFSAKFSTARFYLGSSGLLSKLILSLRSEKVVLEKDDGPVVEDNDRAEGLSSIVEDSLRGVWGLCLGMMRLHTVRRARKLAKRGYLVICDRWPQSHTRGMLDGPVRRKSARTIFPVETLFRLEERIYKKIDQYRPDLMIHLEASFDVAEARKPGELSRSNFEKRRALMALERGRFEGIAKIDVSQSLDNVRCNIVRRVWDLL